jgi:hypothetical protein
MPAETVQTYRPSNRELMGSVTVTSFNPVIKADGSGPLEGYFSDLYADDPLVQFCTQYRTRGAVGGSHYHKGEDRSKSPEELLVLSGSIEIVALFVCGEMQEIRVTVPFGQPKRVLISPWVWHQVHFVQNTTPIPAANENSWLLLVPNSATSPSSP